MNSQLRSGSTTYWQARADTLVFAALCLHALGLLALANGTAHASWTAWLAGSVVLVAGGLWWRAVGSLPAVLAMTAGLISLVAAQLWLAPNAMAPAMGACASLSLLVGSRRWPVPAVAGLSWMAVLAYGQGGGDIGGVNWVALAVLATLTLFVSFLCNVGAQRERERFDVEFLIRAMGKDGPIRLSMEVVRAESVLGERLKQVQQRMAQSIRHVRKASQGVQGASKVLDNDSAELKARAEQSATGLRDAAMCLEQISVIVRDSAEAAMQARATAASASQLAGQGGELFGQVVSTMQNIDAASRKITEIIGVIDGIAFQTNILALNAAVEAARAGEQGRGFAVVAAEVRRLALSSTDAAREIKSLINASIETVASGRELVNSAGATMTDLVSAVRQVDIVFNSLSADTSEHASGIEAVTQSMKDLDELTRQNVTVAERTGQIAHELLSYAGELGEVLGSFKLGDPMGASDQNVARPLASAAPSPGPRDSVPTPVPAAQAAASSPASNVEMF